MSWVEWRIQQYNQGEKANWLEKRCLEHANPVHLVLQVLGSIPFIYGLWIHNLGFILLGLLLNATGHLYCLLIKQKET